MSNYEWPTDEVKQLWLKEAGGDEQLAIKRHTEDLLQYKAEKRAIRWMMQNGWFVSPDGSWRDKSWNWGGDVWRFLLQKATNEVKAEV